MRRESQCVRWGCRRRCASLDWHGNRGGSRRGRPRLLLDHDHIRVVNSACVFIVTLFFLCILVILLVVVVFFLVGGGRQIDDALRRLSHGRLGSGWRRGRLGRVGVLGGRVERVCIRGREQRGGAGCVLSP